MSQPPGLAQKACKLRSPNVSDSQYVAPSMTASTPVTSGNAGSSVPVHDNDNAESRSGADSKPRSKISRQREEDLARETSDLIDRTIADLEGQMAEFRQHQARRGQEITNLTLFFEEMGKDLDRLQAQFETLECQIGDMRCNSEVLNRAVLELRRQEQVGLTGSDREELAHSDNGIGGPVSTSFGGSVVSGSQGGQEVRFKRPRSADDDNGGTRKRRRHEE
ncbi:hypothetical protein PV04_01434 [Phialophora macrospora]|uniref:Uncharacterized protein n=1 Tax=Phialophora macrospora TaxID=1851006 RepID=A0A0D2FXT7_9EURO|nr:hypothetical protein PV04_01434 [Phialophora macrospora]